ncbi:hypothetical protein C8Q76DRAFT_835687 [Earliella scabrosa]|nr:hypothetical protein C8Q76DRAFT_835687 [Earliella scabrosa]
MHSTPPCAPPQHASALLSRTTRHRLVGRREHVLWHRRRYWIILGRVAMDTWLPRWPRTGLRHWMGRSSSRRTCAKNSNPARSGRDAPTRPFPPACTLGQRRSRGCGQQRALAQQTHQRRIASHPLAFGGRAHLACSPTCFQSRQRHRRALQRRRAGFPGRLPSRLCAHLLPTSTAPLRQTPLTVMTAIAVTANPEDPSQPRVDRADHLRLNESPLRPPCRAEERIFLWRGVNPAPRSTINAPILQVLADRASRASLRDTTGYGSGLRKFHVFCDIFAVTEQDRLPASFSLLHSFALWASTDPDPLDPVFADGTPFEPVSIETTRKYLAAVRAWHIAQGWPPPLSEDELTRINWSLRGLANIQAGKRTRPPRPPVTVHMLLFLRNVLRRDTPFDACLSAVATCAFWGMMRFGEVSVHRRVDFSPTRHLTRADVVFASDLDGRPFVKLLLRAAKTAKPGEVQEVFLTQQGSLCPIDALRNLALVVPASASDPLFSWRDSNGEVRPLVRGAALERFNAILSSGGFGTTFGHSFRIGGVVIRLSFGVNRMTIQGGRAGKKITTVTNGTMSEKANATVDGRGGGTKQRNLSTRASRSAGHWVPASRARQAPAFRYLRLTVDYKGL